MFFPIFYFLSHLTVSPEPFGYTINYVLLWFKWSHSLSNIHWHFFFLQSIILIWQTRSVLLVFLKSKVIKNLISLQWFSIYLVDYFMTHIRFRFSWTHTLVNLKSTSYIYAIKIPPKVFLVQKRRKKNIPKVRILFK